MEQHEMLAFLHIRQLQAEARQHNLIKAANQPEVAPKPKATIRQRVGFTMIRWGQHLARNPKISVTSH